MAYDAALLSAAEQSGSPTEMHRLICVDQADSNHNKYWNGFVYPNHTFVARYGRVGGHEAVDVQGFTSGDSAKLHLEKKLREKQNPKKGYVPQRTLASESSPSKTTKTLPSENLGKIALEQLGARDPETARIIDLFAKRNIHEIMQRTTLTYDESRGTFSTPLGIVTADAITDARALLATMGQFVQASDWDAREFKASVNQYLMTVPQSFGMGKLDLRGWLPDMNAVASQNGILDSLQASLDMVLSGTTEDKEAKPEVQAPTPKIFDVTLSVVDDRKELDAIRAMYRTSKNGTHQSSQLDVVRVWRVQHAPMNSAFEGDGMSVGNIQRYWHGSRAGNILSILAKGLIIPPANASFCAGRMYGDGIYASDQSTKSLNYSYGYWDRSAKDDNCFMFVVDMAMGRMFTPKSYSECSGIRKAKEGYDSTFAEGGKSGVANNEMIVYRASQVNIKYLVEFAPSAKATH